MVLSPNQTFGSEVHLGLTNPKLASKLAASSAAGQKLNEKLKRQVGSQLGNFSRKILVANNMSGGWLGF